MQSPNRVGPFLRRVSGHQTLRNHRRHISACLPHRLFPPQKLNPGMNGLILSQHLQLILDILLHLKCYLPPSHRTSSAASPGPKKLLPTRVDGSEPSLQSLATSPQISCRRSKTLANISREPARSHLGRRENQAAADSLRSHGGILWIMLI